MISLLTRRYTYRGDRENDGEKGREREEGGRVCNCSTRKRERWAERRRDQETERRKRRRLGS